ncbi:hypothetical protein COLO4_19868, partial [Corchorus olitorius]
NLQQEIQKIPDAHPFEEERKAGTRAARAYRIGYNMGSKSNDSEPSDLELQLQDILREDNKNKFLLVLKDKYEAGSLTRDVARWVCAEGATKCAQALLEEETGLTFDIHDTIYDEHKNWTPLHSASEAGHLPFVSLLLHHGAQPNIRSRSSKRYFNKKLPLNCVLSGIKAHAFFKSHDWSPAKHIFRVIIILCLPQMREKLEALTLLVERTEEVEKEISGYIIEGKVIELAALLIATPEKVMSPSVFENLCPTGQEGSMTFGDFFMKEVMALESLKLSSMSSRTHPKVERKCKRQHALIMPVFQLLGIFDRVGDSIHTYLKEERQKVSDQNIAKEVASILLGAGYPLKEHDYNLSMFNWSLCHQDSYLRESCEEGCGKLKTPEHGTPDPVEQVKFSQTKYGSLTSSAVDDQNCNYDRPQLTEELKNLCNHEYLKDWNRRKSIFKLIYILCLPELQGGLLKRIRSLALDSEDIEKFSCHCLKEGKLVEFAVLLMMAHERLIGKTAQNGGASLLDNSMGLRGCLTRERTSAIYEEIMSKGTFQNKDVVLICKARKKIMSSAQLLFEVFERAGYRIDRYLQSDTYYGITSNLQVAKDVAFLLKEEGFALSQGDTNLSNMKCFLTKLELEPEQTEKLRLLIERSPVRNVGLPLCSPVHMLALSD